jgi:hypothetical protein
LAVLADAYTRGMWEFWEAATRARVLLQIFSILTLLYGGVSEATLAPEAPPGPPRTPLWTLLHPSRSGPGLWGAGRVTSGVPRASTRVKTRGGSDPPSDPSGVFRYYASRGTCPGEEVRDAPHNNNRGGRGRSCIAPAAAPLGPSRPEPRKAPVFTMSLGRATGVPIAHGAAFVLRCYMRLFPDDRFAPPRYLDPWVPYRG